jgi:hypothetical protein
VELSSAGGVRTWSVAIPAVAATSKSFCELIEDNIMKNSTRDAQPTDMCENETKN